VPELPDVPELPELAALTLVLTSPLASITKQFVLVLVVSPENLMFPLTSNL